MKSLFAFFLAAALLTLSGCEKKHDPQPAQPQTKQPKAVPVVGPVATGPTLPRP